mgnify:CR=1 FL=1
MNDGIYLFKKVDEKTLAYEWLICRILVNFYQNSFIKDLS